jgi:4-aminobutyrate aminotransferase-like enzyme
VPTHTPFFTHPTTLTTMSSSAPLTREQVKNLKPNQVHETLGRKLLVDGFDVVYDLDKSKDLYLHDARTGRDFLDFFSFFASWPISVPSHSQSHRDFLLRKTIF